MRRLTALAAISLFCLRASAAGPVIVTVAKADDKHVRNSEGTAVGLKDGRLLLAWIEFTKGERDSDFFPARIVAKTSKDGGKTWSKPRHIETDAGWAFSNPGAYFTSKETLFLNYWACKYTDKGYMSNYPIDLKAAIIEKKWLYGE